MAGFLDSLRTGSITNTTNMSPVPRSYVLPGTGLGQTLAASNADAGDYMLVDNATGAVASPTSDVLKDAGIDVASTVTDTAEESGFLDNLLKEKYMMGNIAGLASTLMQAAALPTMLKQAKLQNKSLQFNLDTAKEEQARRNKNISAFNSFQG
jgi:hypothetical protein